MKKTFKKLTALALTVLMMVTLVGCNDLFNWNRQPDPLLENIQTKEQAYDFISDTSKSWNYIKAKATFTFITLPYEGHIDFANKIAYIEKYSTNNNIKELSDYYYLKDDHVYTYSKTVDGETYETSTINSEFGLDISLETILSMIDKETTDLDIDSFIYEKTDYQVSLAFDYSIGSEVYKIDLVYKNDSIRIAVENLATIILEKDDPTYFDNLNIDLTLFDENN